MPEAAPIEEDRRIHKIVRPNVYTEGNIGKEITPHLEEGTCRQRFQISIIERCQR